MGTGIGVCCRICGNQLNYNDGFDGIKQICKSCDLLVPKVMKYLIDNQSGGKE